MALNPYEHRGVLGHLAATRRQFLQLMGAIASFGALVFGGFEIIKFMFPQATLEDPTEFKVQQDPATITIGSPLQITDKRVTIVRDNGGLYAVYLVCTHLGCTPNYSSDVTGDLTPDIAARAKQRGDRPPDLRIPNGWACPCHGSRYFIDSTNFYGPAPRPMDWVKISFGKDGKLLVDRGVLVASRVAGDTRSPEWRLDPVTQQDNGKVMGV